MEQNQKKKKIPVRQCLGCNEHRSKFELLRVVRDPEGNVSLDFTGKKSGRGAYICKNVACLQKAQKRRSLSRALECDIPDDVFAAMEAQLHAEQ
ncbi:MAG: YlxR family protein [Clostridia bacterium]|nr:YlxR family protein [Clostridia bacterium]